MSVEQKLTIERNGRNRKDDIIDVNENLSKNINGLSKNQNFFHLPLKNIFSLMLKINFNFIDESDDRFEILLNIIQNIINAHYKEKETLLILQNIDISQLFLSFEKIISMNELFINCSILQHFCNLYNEKQQLPEIDYEYELRQKDKEIEKLKKQIKEFHSQTQIDFQPIAEKPKDFESDIFKACKEGKLTSVQWLIEKENVDKNKSVEKNDEDLDFCKNDTPIHIASKYGHLLIVQYLIEKQNVYIDIIGCCYIKPRHYACEEGHLPIAEYLISKGANINTKDSLEQTPLHWACEKGHLPIAEYLISKGANINAKDRNGDYVIHYASIGGLLPIIQYLIEQKNIDIDIKNKIKWTPLHYACVNGHLPIVEYSYF